ncbi:hypothetical protein [Bacillus salipaludis]|nr:hypothetical protein [Bacillus salipaludis]
MAKTVYTVLMLAKKVFELWCLLSPSVSLTPTTTVYHRLSHPLGVALMGD